MFTQQNSLLDCDANFPLDCMHNIAAWPDIRYGHPNKQQYCCLLQLSASCTPSTVSGDSFGPCLIASVITWSWQVIWRLWPAAFAHRELQLLWSVTQIFIFVPAPRQHVCITGTVTVLMVCRHQVGRCCLIHKQNHWLYHCTRHEWRHASRPPQAHQHVRVWSSWLGGKWFADEPCQEASLTRWLHLKFIS